MIGILIFAFISFPLFLVPPEHFRKPFLYGSIIMTVATFSIFIWALAKEGGGGPLLTHPSELSGVQALSGGSKLGWAMAYGVSSTIGSTSAGILNQSDFTRFAAYPRAQIVSQLIIVPLSVVVIAFVGVIVTSCAAGFYPDDGLLWAPYDLLPVIQARGGPGARAACFFAGCAFVISQFGINIPGNAVSGGIDLAGLLPKYINIRRYAVRDLRKLWLTHFFQRCLHHRCARDRDMSMEAAHWRKRVLDGPEFILSLPWPSNCTFAHSP